MSKELVRWFETRLKVEAIRMINTQVKIAVVSIEELIRGIKLAIDGKELEFEESLNRQSKTKKESDVLRRKIVEELAKGELPPDDRVGLMHLTRQIDEVIDWTLGSQRILDVFRLKNVPPELQDLCVEMTDTIAKCVITVEDCIQKLADRKTRETFDAAEGVRRLEEDVDTLYQRARKLLLLMETPKTGLGSLVLLAEFLNALENIADRCEDTCDQVRVILVSFSKGL